MLSGYSRLHDGSTDRILGRPPASDTEAEVSRVGPVDSPRHLPEAAYDMVRPPKGRTDSHDQHGLARAPDRTTVSQGVAVVTAW
jgi:hypothetical protein